MGTAVKKSLRNRSICILGAAASGRDSALGHAALAVDAPHATVIIDMITVLSPAEVLHLLINGTSDFGDSTATAPSLPVFTGVPDSQLPKSDQSQHYTDYNNSLVEVAPGEYKKMASVNGQCIECCDCARYLCC